eukprot:symbB.v1.2.024005.t1/scaffold2216.1/size85545/5
MSMSIRCRQTLCYGQPTWSLWAVPGQRCTLGGLWQRGHESLKFEEPGHAADGWSSWPLFLHDPPSSSLKRPEFSTAKGWRVGIYSANGQ